MASFIIPPRPGGNPYLPDTNATRTLIGPLQLERHAAAVDIGAVRDVDVIPREALDAWAAREFTLWGNAITADRAGYRSMQTMLRVTNFVAGTTTYYDGTKHSAATIMFGPAGNLAGTGPGGQLTWNGMPREEAEVYFARQAGAPSAFERVLVRALRAAITPGLGPINRLSVRADLTFSTSAGDERPDFVPPFARTAGPLALIAQVPRIYEGETEIIQGTPVDMANWADRVQSDILTFLHDIMPQKDSNRVLDSIISCNVWGRRTQIVAGRVSPINRGSAMRGRFVANVGGSDLSAKRGRHLSSLEGARSFAALADGAPPPEDAFVVPDALFKCKGLSFVDPRKQDGRCVARAMIQGVQLHVASRSDTALVSIARAALTGARKMLDTATAAVSAAVRNGYSSTSLALRAKEAHVEACAARVMACTHRLEAAFETARKAGHHVRAIDGSSRGKYATSSSYAAVDDALRRAFTGLHPLFDFRDPLFARPIAITAENVLRIRAAIKDPSKVRVQFWGVGHASRVALNFPDGDATLAFLEAGGLVVNIFYGYNHASVLLDVGKCCNHAAAQAAGVLVERLYCGLCGSHVSRGVLGAEFRLYEHAARGCLPPSADMLFTAPLSYANRRQIGKRSRMSFFPAPLILALDQPEDGLATYVQLALLPGGYRQALSHRAFRDRFRGMDESTTDWMAAQLSETPAEFLLKPTVAELLREVLAPDRIDELVEHLYYRPPRDASHWERVGSSSTGPCVVCLAGLEGPSVWVLQARESAAQGAPGVDAPLELLPLSGDADASRDSADVADADVVLLSDGDACTDAAAGPAAAAATGSVRIVDSEGKGGWAHADCARFCVPRSTVTVEVGGREAFAAVVETVFSEAFITSHCLAPPTATRGTFGLRRVQVRVKGRTRRGITVVFRPREAFFSDPAPGGYAGDYAHFLLQMAWREFAATGLDPLAYETRISFGRALAFRMSAYDMPPQLTPTSISSQYVLDQVARIARGGMTLLGCAVDHPPLDPTDLSHMRFYLDATAAYPAVLRDCVLPLHEHADRFVADFSADLEGGLAHLRAQREESEDVYRYVVSGYFPASRHAALRMVPPVWQAVEVTGAMLSAFQRASMGIAKTQSLGTRSVAHLLPVENLPVFFCEVSAWLRLGFVFTKIGEVRCTPGARWCHTFAARGETRRRAAKVAARKARAAGDDAAYAAAKASEQDVKETYNAVVGSLNMDVSKFFSLVTAAPFLAHAEGAEDDGSAADERFVNDPLCTGRSWTAGDCVLHERASRTRVHAQLTLAALYVVAKARRRLLDAWYGLDDKPGIVQAFPHAYVCYGATDSLIVGVQLSEAAKAWTRDVRHEFFAQWGRHRMDYSNVPATSSFWHNNPFAAEARALAVTREGAWGAWKDESGQGGLLRVGVTAPLHWCAEYRQVEGDTLPEHVARPHVVKSVHAVWRETMTVDDYMAAWRGADTADLVARAAEVPLPDRAVAGVGGDLGRLGTAPVHRSTVNVCGNRSAIVSKKHNATWPLGSLEPGAVAAVAGAEE